MVEKGEQAFPEGHHPRAPVRVQHVHVEAEADFQFRVAERLLHHGVGIDGAVARHQQDAHVFGGLVDDLLDRGQLARVDGGVELLEQARLLDLVGDFGHDRAPEAAFEPFDLPARPHAQTAPPGAVRFRDRGRVFGKAAAGGEVGPRHMRRDLLILRGRPADQVQQGGGEFARIVRRDVGRHADRDALRPVGQQVGEGRRQHCRLAALPVIGLAEIDRVLVDALQQRLGHRRQPRLGVAHGGGVVAVDIAEIAVALDQRVADGELLREAHHRVIDRRIAVGMVFAHDIADDAGAFLEAGGGVEPQFAHGVDEAAVDRLQPVAHIRERARGNRRERIGEIPLAQRRAEGDGLNDSGDLVGHGALRMLRIGIRFSIGCLSPRNNPRGAGVRRAAGGPPARRYGGRGNGR